MSLTLRNTKGSALTYTEMDDNLEYLEDLVVGTSGSGVYLPLDGGTMSGDVEMGTSTSITSSDGGVLKFQSDGDTDYIALSSGSDEFIAAALLLNTNGDSILTSPEKILVGGGAHTTDPSSSDLTLIGWNGVEIESILDDIVMRSNSGEVDITGSQGIKLSISNSDLLIAYNVSSSVTTPDFDKYPTIISSRNSTVNTSVVNSVILGGDSITADTDNTAYMQHSVNTGVAQFAEYTVAGVPTASSYAGGMIAVTDETGGYTMAFSDGTNWRRVQDRAIIS